MTAIRVESLSKRYILRHNTDGRDGLRHSLEAALRSPLKWLRERRLQTARQREEFWALRDLTFEINQGDAVAIIGRNGAGKSTLLKILSRITEPTSGRIHLKGRVASLLEVGTGFHQELTGRENIFLNGAILGMSRAEITKRFDAIVAFSEVEKFLDTPVKRYSSGMYVRLAFAVAAHLEPEILIVDEVLAVGDAAFQRKCLGRMSEVARDGRTVLFVSHNMPAVQALCTRALILVNGQKAAMGDAAPIVRDYLANSGTLNGHRFQAAVKMGDAFTLESLSISPDPVEAGQATRFHLKFRASAATTFKDLSLLVYSAQGSRVAIVDLRALRVPLTMRAGEVLQIDGQINSVPLVEGDYSIGLHVKASGIWDNLLDLTTFTVAGRPTAGDYAPYDIVYRGTVDLDFNASARITSAP